MATILLTSPRRSPTQRRLAPIPIILAGQKVFINAPASSIPALTVLRSGTIITNALNVPYTTQFNAGVQRELPWNSVIDLNYLYTRSTH